MLGDFLREAAVLVVVFLPLDRILRSELTVGDIVATTLTSGALLAAGVIVERARKTD